MTNKIGFYCDDNNEVNENIETIAMLANYLSFFKLIDQKHE